jgi:hypothetical protein
MVARPGARRVTSLFVAMVAFGLAMARERAASAFELEGHEVIEAAAYKRILSSSLVRGTRVSGRTLLATLIADGVLYQPRCFDLAHPRGGCPLGGRLQVPLAYWPVLGSGAMDLIINRQLNQEGQCQHFMAETKDGLSPPDPRSGTPIGLGVTAYKRCATLAGVAFDGILRNPRRANWRLVGTYALMHAIEDSFSAAHVARDDRWRIVHLLSWTLIDWPAYFRRRIFAFPPETHHAVSDARDKDYLRADARTEQGDHCDELANPYAVPESCLTPRALLAVSAIEDLLVDLYRLRDQGSSEGRTATLWSPASADVWREFLAAHLAGAEATADVPTFHEEGPPRPDVFVGVRATEQRGGFGVGLWGARLLVGPAIPFALTVAVSAGYTRADGVAAVGGGVGVGLLLPLVRRVSIGALPAGAQVQCDTSFKGCTIDAVATVGNLIVPLGERFWAGLEGPRWSWTDRAFTGNWFGAAFGWAPEQVPRANASAKEAALVWDPPRPEDVTSFRESRWTFLAYVAASEASTADNTLIAGGLGCRRDRDRWNRRSGVGLGIELEGQHGVINGNAHAGAVSVAPLLVAYVLPDRLALTAAPALVQVGDVTRHGFGADVAGRLGLALDLGKVELAVDSAPLSYLSRERWHALPVVVKLGLLFD